MATIYLLVHPVFVTMTQCLVGKSPKAVPPGLATVQTELDPLDQVSVSMVSLSRVDIQLHRVSDGKSYAHIAFNLSSNASMSASISVGSVGDADLP